MSALQKITPEILATISCDPQNSVIIEACAGSGKTWQLVSRIFRLLLSGVKPQEILAITFTRKAAQEMRARLNTFLESIENLPEGDLINEMVKRGIDKEKAVTLLPKARGLFEEVLSNPRKISIDTFHGWFSRICQVAPVGVGVPQGASLREDVKRLLDDSLAGWWSDLGQAKGEFAQLRRYYEQLLQTISAKGVDQILVGGGGIVHQRAAWMRFASECQKSGLTPLDRVKARLPLVGLEDPLGKAINEDPSWNDLEKIAAFMQACNAPNDVKYGSAIAQGYKAHKDGETLDNVALKIHSGFLTGDNAVYKKYEKCSSALEKYLKETGNHDWLVKLPEIRLLWAEVLQQRCEWVKQNQLYAINRAWMSLGESMIERYQDAKEFNRTQDFSDLEWHASRLMQDEASAAYLQARLDASYKHILIDEFQDTNPLQWQILQGWLAAYDKSDDPPKIFIVGDPKQSIYRFRGADARLFQMAKNFLLEKFDAKQLNLDQTRRNSIGVLEGVNKAFLPLVEMGYPYRLQETLWKSQENSSDIGGTYLLPLIPYQEEEPEPEFRSALEQAIPERRDIVPATLRYNEALRVGNLIKELKETKVVLDESEGQQFSRPAQWGDFLVLIKRKRYLPEIERAFRKLGVPCDSPRQGGLLQTLEADDLRCLLEVLLTPANNLALAQVLRSPLFCIEDKHLQAISNKARQEGQSWWQSLSGFVDLKLKDTFTKLQSWMNLSQSLPVHDLLDHIYAEGDVRRCYANLSPPLERDRVLANLDAFLALALEVDGGRYPSLSRFIEELRFLKAGYQEESPDEGESIDEEVLDTDALAKGGLGVVRLMTIHSAKGLEAPFVFILDTNTDAINKDHSGLVIDWDPQSSSPDLVCAYSSSLATAGVELALEKEGKIVAQESWNLLYVAMTRAKQDLYISGVSVKGKAGDLTALNKNSWYSHLSNVGIQELIVKNEFNDANHELAKNSSSTNQHHQEFDFYDFGQGTWRAPSAFKLQSSDEGVTTDLNIESRELGTILHAILENLTVQYGGVQTFSIEKVDERRLSAWLNLPIAKTVEAWRIAKNILTSQELAIYFDPKMFVQAWNELDILDQNNLLFRIDRLVEFEDHLMILDYKLSIPDAQSDLFKQYLSQISNYKTLVSRLRADKPVKAGFIDQTGKIFKLAEV